MKKFFISSDNFKKLMLSTICIFFLMPWKVIIVWVFFLALMLKALKKNKVILNDSLSNSSDILIAPVSGLIKSITKTESETRYRIKLSKIKNYGLYFPYSSTLGKIETTGSRALKAPQVIEINDDVFRTDIEFLNKIGSSLRIVVYRCMFSGKPHIWPKTGDKGRVSSNFGFLPFGGVIDIVTSSDCDQLVSVGDKVFAGSTILAGFKG